MQPLENIKVLDLGRALAGPICSMMLADLGADVIKIEPPGLGDDSREWPPLQGGESSYFASFNRNKRSLVLDLSRPEGQEIFRDMAREADVVVENYRNGVMDRFGLGYEDLAAINPRIVYCAITGFGRTGPFADKPATDIYMQAFSGLMSVTGEKGRSPVRIGVSLCDITAGLLANIGILAALQARAISGRGQLVDTSLLEGQMALISYLFTAYGVTGKVPGPLGSGHPSIVPYQVFEVSDGWVSLATFNDRLFGRAVDAMGLSALKEDPRFVTNLDRVEHRQELTDILQARFLDKTIDEWVAAMEANDVPLAPVHTVDRVMTHPQVQHREMIQRFEHPTAGEFSIFGFPIKFNETPCLFSRPPPTLGEHSREILEEFGVDGDRVTRLAEQGITHLGTDR